MPEQTRIKQPDRKSIRQWLNSFLTDLSSRSGNADLRLAIPLILASKDLGYNPKELREKGVVDVGKRVTQELRFELAKRMPSYTLKREIIGKERGRIISRFFFIKSDSPEADQIPLGI